MSVTIFSRRNAGILAAVCAAAITSTGFAQDSDRPMIKNPPVLTSASNRLTAEQEKELATFYASKLFLACQYEMELCKLASTRSSDPDVKNLAETAHREHLEMLSSLKTMVPSSLAATVPTTKVADNETDDEIEFDDEDEGFGEEDSDDEVTGEDRDPPESSDRTTVGRVTYTEINDPILRRISEIERLATKNRLSSYQATMNRVRGAEFDIAFLDHEIVSHTNLISELSALNGVGSSEFRWLVSKANRTLKSHLTAAHELAETLKSVGGDDELEDPEGGEEEGDYDDGDYDDDDGGDDGLLNR